MRKIAFFIHWNYLKKRKHIFKLEKRHHLENCNRVIEIYRIKQNHFYFPRCITFKKDDLYIKPIVFQNKDDFGLKGIKNRFLFKLFCFKYKIKTKH